MRWRLLCGVVAATGSSCAVVAGLDREYYADPQVAGPDGGGTDAALDAAPLLPASCLGQLAKDPATGGRDGIYTVDPDGPGAGAPLSVYCQMTLDDGGWTLVGRSGTSAATRFGWTSDAGRVDDVAASYSLDVAGVGLTFHEIMLADRDQGSPDIATRAYKLSVPVDFFQKYPDAFVPTNAVTTLLGDCRPPDGPTMLRYAGAVARTDSFYFRDIPDISQHTGLSPTRFELTYDDCPRGGMLNKAGGLVFVR